MHLLLKEWTGRTFTWSSRRPKGSSEDGVSAWKNLHLFMANNQENYSNETQPCVVGSNKQTKKYHNFFPCSNLWAFYWFYYLANWRLS